MAGLAHSQILYTLEAEAGANFNPKIELANQTVKKANASSIHFSANALFPIGKKVFIEAGPGTRLVYNRAKIGPSSFSTLTFRVELDALVGMNFSKKWQSAIGVSFQNNRDFEYMEVFLPYNFRFDALFKVKYKLIDKLWINARLSYNINQLGDAFLVNDPKAGVLFGITYVMNHKQLK